MSTLGFGFGSPLSALSISPVTSPHMWWQGSATEAIAVDPALAAALKTVQYASDTIGMNPLLETYKALYASAVETVGVQQADTVLRGIVLLERLRLAESVTPNARSSITFSDTVSIVEALLAGRPVSALETIGTGAALVVQQATTLIESLGLSASVLPQAIYKRGLAETLQLTSSLANFLGAFAAETLQIEDARAVQLKASGALVEGLGVTDVSARQLLIRVVANETVGIDDIQVLNLLLGVSLVEEIELSVGYLSPGESFTTWTMNTRSGAVSEYSDYVFNSFARVGNKYIGASDSGLYELTGDTDAGDPIVSVLKGAFLQFGGTHLSRLKEAYIAATGDEDVFVLKIETLDGATYTYQVDTRSGRNTKVHMGKGQRARYFAYTLTSAGQDFTLDTLEFVPITVQRRV